MTFNRLCSKLILFSSLFLLGACSPKQESSTVQLKFPDWQELRAKDIARQSKLSSLAVSEADLHMITVNVTGPGIAQPIYFNWERDSNPVPPSIVTLPFVPRGNDRLVQVLAIYEDGGAMAFYYGDQRINITSDVANADIEVANEATTQNLVEGRIAGRFLTGPNQGYTGVVQLRFNPPSGAPPMVAHMTELFSGWGELFALSTPLITFTRPDGSKMFEGFTNDTHSIFNAQNMARAVRVHIPGGYENKSHESGQYEMRPKKRQRLLVGYFGYYDAASTDTNQRVCVPNPASLGSALDVNDLYKTADLANPTAAPSNPIKWIGRLLTGRVATDHAYVEAVVPPSGTLSYGGDVSGTCASDTTKRYTEFIDLTGTSLDHADEMLGIRGPYGKHPDAGSGSSDVVATSFDDAANKLTIEWDYLPGTAIALAGTSVFYRSKPGYDVWDDRELRAGEGFRCNALTKLGFTEIPVGQGIETADIPNINDSTQASALQILVCPKGHHGFFYQAAAPAGYGNHGGGGSPATKLVLTGPDGETNNIMLMSQSCTPIRVRGLTATDGSAQFPNGTQLTLSATTGTHDFFDNPDCDNAPLSFPKDFSNQWADFTFYVKRVTAGPGAGTISVSDASGQLTSAAASTDVIDPVPANKIKVIAPAQLVAHSCYPMAVQTRYDDGTTSRVATWNTDTVWLDLPSVANLEFYDANDWSCSGTQISLGSAGTLGNLGMILRSTQYFRFKYKGSSGFSLTPTTAHGTFAGNVQDVTYTSAQIAQPGSISQFMISGQNQSSANNCMPVSIGFYDSAQNPTPVVSGTNGGLSVDVNLSTSPAGQGDFYETHSACTGNVANVGMTQIPVGAATKTIYFKPTVANTTVALNAQSVAPSHNSSYNVNVGSAPPASLAIKLQGQTLTAGFATGPQPVIAAGVDFNINVYALKSDSNVETSFNGQLDWVNGPGSYMQITPGPINFVNGVASLMVRFNTREANVSLNASALGGAATGNSTLFFVEDDVQPATFKFYKTSTTWIENTCQPALITFQTNEVFNSPYWVGHSAPLASSKQMNFVYVSGLAASYYADPNCGGGPVVNVNVPTGSRGALIGVRYSATGSSNFNITDDSSILIPGASGTLTIASGSVVNADEVHIIGQSDVELGACQAYAAVLIDNSTGSASTLPSNEILNFSGSAMTFHTDSNCATPQVGSITIPSGSNSVMFYGRASMTGNHPSSLNPTSTYGLTVQSLNLRVF